MAHTLNQDAEVRVEPSAISPDPAGHSSLDAVRATLLDAKAVEAVAEVFKLLGDPTRVRIVDALSRGERCVCDLASLVSQTESAVSHQLRLLRAARLVRVRRAGRHAYYALDDHHVVGLLHDTRKHVEEEHS
jgi:ArsR family transcriptional regulator, lead/cadmium/zinc/bismuth-responsive transcriptional repressor